MSMVKVEHVKRMHIELSSKCNASCPGCPRNVRGGYDLPWLDKDEWKLEQFKHFFSPEFLQQIDSILFCGNYGDPGTCIDLAHICEYIKQCNWELNIRIHTNGGMRTTEFWKQLAQVLNHNKDTVIFSIDGLEDTNHLYRRNVVWSKLMSNVQAYLDEGGQATWEFLLFGHNQHQLEQAQQMSRDMGFENFFYKKAFGFTDEVGGKALNGMQVLDRKGKFEYLIPAPDDSNLNIYHKSNVDRHGQKFDPEIFDLVKPVFERHFEHQKRDLQEHLQAGHLDWLDEHKYISCMSWNNKEIFVDAQGGVHPCCFLGHVSQQSDGIMQHQYWDWIQKNIGMDNINLNNHSLEHILDESGYFDKIEATWGISKHRDGKIALCTKHCMSKHNPIDSLYESQKRQQQIREQQKQEQDQ